MKSFSNFRIVLNPHKTNAQTVRKQIETYLKKHDKQVIFSDQAVDQEDLVISLGGDGTLLKAARSLKNPDVPILGINLGNLGFLADIPAQKIETCLDQIICGNYYLEPRTQLTTGKNLQALNDVVIASGKTFRVIQMLVFIDDHFFSEIVGDGFIISTPTGSTAYSLSVGGPIVYPTMEVIILNAISPHMLSLRPLIVPGKSTIKIQICSDLASVVIDGQTSENLSKGSTINITQSPHKVKLLKIKGMEYFNLLRSKLRLGDLKARRICEDCDQRFDCPYPKLPI
ncbi:MAG: NAD(+)/NADH kinase [bacterium]